MKKILVPTNFTEYANNALHLALSLAEKSDQDVVVQLLHVINPEKFYTITEDGDYMDASKDENYRQHLVEKAGEKLEEMIENTQSQKLTASVETGDIQTIVSEYVERESIDLLVTGAHETSIYEELLFVSNIDKIIHAVSCPVLTITKKAENFKADNVIFATDLKADLSPMMPQLKEFQRLFGSTIHLVYINTPNDFLNNRRINDMKETYIESQGFQDYTFTIYNDFTVETGITNFAQDVDADIIALPSHHFNSMLDEVSTNRISDIVIDEAKRPVLTFSVQ